MAQEKYMPIEIKENEKEILKISEMAQVLLRERHGINLTALEGIATVAYAFTVSAMEYVNQRKAPGTDYSLNVLELYEVGIQHRENEESEKEGNYTPFLIPGKEFKLLAKDDDDTEE